MSRRLCFREPISTPAIRSTRSVRRSLAPMSRRLPSALLSLVAILACRAPRHAPEESASVAWEPWSEELFERARREQKLVLLDLEAVWCHWCHVMDEVTYRDPEVARLVREHCIAVKVDQDSRPD